MNTRPFISVIVPFRNARSHLSLCIESLLRQTLPRERYELLFIDNNSTDGGDQIVSGHPEISLLRERTQSSYAARNHGISRAKGSIIAFTDADCQPDKDWLEKILAALSSNRAAIVLGYRASALNTPLMRLITAYESQKVSFIKSAEIPELFYGYTNNMAMTKELFDRIGPFPEITRGGDTVFVQRAVKAYGCEVIHFRPEIRVRHLELVGIASYYRKKAIYGSSNERLQEMVSFRPLSSKERWRVFNRTVEKEKLSFLQILLLTGVLLPGGLIYEASSFFARRRQMFFPPSTIRPPKVLLAGEHLHDFGREEGDESANRKS